MNQVIGQRTITLDSTVLEERILVDNINIPWELLWGPDDYLWMTERRGVVSRINPSTGTIDVILDITSEVAHIGEAGLLGMVLHPDFEITPRVYVVYCYSKSQFVYSEKLVSYDWDGANLTNETILLDGIKAFLNHNGSRLVVSKDHKLIMTTGDAQFPASAQNISGLSGKVLRLNLDGTIPEDNPIADSYVYSYGHRNPQGLAIGPNGEIFSSEHGADEDDEINIIEPNRNYGWPNVEGACNTEAEITFCELMNVKEPIRTWSPCVAVNDLLFYQHDAIPEWKGNILMAVLGGRVHQSGIYVLKFNSAGTEIVGEQIYFNDYGRLRDICFNPYTGAIYFASDGRGGDDDDLFNHRIIEYAVEITSDVINPIMSLDQAFINVIPNYVRRGGSFSITFSKHFLGQSVDLFSINGQIIESKKIDQSFFEISTNKFSPGIYFLKVKDSNGKMYTKNIVVQ